LRSVKIKHGVGVARMELGIVGGRLKAAQLRDDVAAVLAGRRGEVVSRCGGGGVIR
jgi:hypothetical protein